MESTPPGDLCSFGEVSDVAVLVVEDEAARGQDRIGAAVFPAHAGLFEALPDDGFAGSFGDTADYFAR